MGDVANSVNLSTQADLATDLMAQWDKVITEGMPRASGGLLNVWMAFEASAAEISGASARFYAADWVVPAAVNRWRDADRVGRRRVNPNEQVPDDSPMAHTLVTLDRVVRAASQAPDGEIDLSSLRL